ncbi:Cyclin dependant kinase 2 [Cedratvirus A11]|uniref:Cyclin dependant kinase 2 n=1 Tax=Cedratvirus A11 TaxID=1903266 RepID=A0A1M7XVH8_9VIRU|nr:Cyclin dependant kinase 2 [Cedratvirus A11]SHO33580.1 Cyclin dependant kinase 2 [Cedratvirus A11]
MKGMEERWGRYVVGKVLGRGVYGEVRVGQSSGPGERFAKSSGPGERFAIKRFFSSGEGLDSPDEIAIALQASHAHIIKAVEYFYQGEQDYLVMELADTNLQDYLFSNSLSIEDKVRLFYELVSAVTYLQENGFYHCDIKPVNVLVKDGHVKLGDLGLTKYKNVTGTSCQTYASPQSVIANYQASRVRVRIDQDLEAIFQERTENFTNDVWALGITFAFLLTGRVLFYEVDTAQKVVDGIQEYIRNPEGYLLQNALPEDWVPLLLQLLEPSAKPRLSVAKDILLQPEFVRRGLYKPIPGYAPVFYDLPLIDFSKKAVSDSDLKTLLGWIDSIVKYTGGNSFVLHASVTCFYYMISFPNPRGVRLLAGACVSLMNKLYSKFLVDVDDLIYQNNTEEELFEEERRILRKMQGRLYFTTLPKLAFSNKAVEESKGLLLHPLLYSFANLHSYMDALLEEETIQERNTRQPVL